jgi:sugar phosphate isomerase/epimerase
MTGVFPFRLGTTSYILPDDILPNVRYLAGRVQDVELVLFEVDDGPNNLPSADAVAELKALADAEGLTYTVHLPLDLRLGAGGDVGHVSLAKARSVIERTRPLNPWAYVLHLDGRELLAPVDSGGGARRAADWQDQAVRALELVSGWAGGPERLAVENLERYPLDTWMPVLERVPAARCVDIGHLWLDHHDPVPVLRAALPRTRVIHLHGVGQRDHQSLALMAPDALDAVLGALLRDNYAGVVTLEIFSESDLNSSLAALSASLGRQG